MQGLCISWVTTFVARMTSWNLPRDRRVERKAGKKLLLLYVIINKTDVPANLEVLLPFLRLPSIHWRWKLHLHSSPSLSNFTYGTCLPRFTSIGQAAFKTSPHLSTLAHLLSSSCTISSTQVVLIVSLGLSSPSDRWFQKKTQTCLPSTLHSSQSEMSNRLPLPYIPSKSSTSPLARFLSLFFSLYVSIANATRQQAVSESTAPLDFLSAL